MSAGLFTLQAGDTAYETVKASTVVWGTATGGAAPSAGIGYWAYFAQPTTLSIAFAPPQPLSGGITRGSFFFPVSTAPGAWVMIGDPYSVPVTVSDVAALETYDPVHGYQPAQTLQPGQGAFALSGQTIRLDLCPVSAQCH